MKTNIYKWDINRTRSRNRNRSRSRNRRWIM